MYARLEEADPLVMSLSTDKDPVLRRSGMYTLAMAYCGTGSNKAIRKLLHVAVSDVNDDVRRAAVTSIGFLLFRVADRRKWEPPLLKGILVGVRRRDVRVPELPKLDPRLWFLRESHVTMEFDLE
uniref:Clathrin/coatomer adaptor adaptin-like N-terminal domain-containing protein n=1 Tax=Phlebotomus papatasi TaxID=29031 RepID=A0A1B0DP83_PHLPP